jgi:hypothetical protein
VLHIKNEFSTFDWLMDKMIEETNFKIFKKDINSNTNIDYYCVKRV